MTPSQHIEARAETIWKYIGVASGCLVLALVRRRIGIATMETVRDALILAAAEAEDLVKYMKRIREN